MQDIISSFIENAGVSPFNSIKHKNAYFKKCVNGVCCIVQFKKFIDFRGNEFDKICILPSYEGREYLCKCFDLEADGHFNYQALNFIVNLAAIRNDFDRNIKKLI